MCDLSCSCTDARKGSTIARIGLYVLCASIEAGITGQLSDKSVTLEAALFPSSTTTTEVGEAISFPFFLEKESKSSKIK
jgi:hypothetical protein